MLKKERPALGVLLVALLLPGYTSSTLATGGKSFGETDIQRYPRFAVSFPAQVRSNPATGRVLLFFSRSQNWEPRLASGLSDLQPVYAIDVTSVKPGELVVFGPEQLDAPAALAFPVALDALEPGTYYVQAVFDLDQTRGNYNAGQGNLYSRAVKCKLGLGRRTKVNLVADRLIKESSAPVDTDWVKLVEIRSQRLSEFHGREVKLRASVVLPAAYSTDRDRQFPALYHVPSFSGDHTLGWWSHRETDHESKPTEVSVQRLEVILDPQVPTGHSGFANSENNGPVGDALVYELVPEIERRFRAIPQPHGRMLTGFSSGGWAALWLQVTYPDFFGGCWSGSPDPVDFRFFQTMNIYEDRNGHWTREGYPRPLARENGKILATFEQVNRWERVVGKGFQLGSFNAVFSPRAIDGHPRPLIDPLTGDIDTRVANHWKRYDLRRVLEENWSTLGPRLKGKLHVIIGGTDTYYLDNAVRSLGDFLKETDYGGYVEIVPGTHGDYAGDALMERFDREMAAHFAAGQRASADRSGARPTSK